MYLAFADVLRTVQQNLMGDVIPDLRSDYAREQAAGLVLLIQHLLTNWDRALDALREENEDLRQTLREIMAAGGPAMEPTGPADRLASSPGDELLGENRELRAWLAGVIATSPDGSATLRLAEAFILRQLERESAAVAGIAPTWD